MVLVYTKVCLTQGDFGDTVVMVLLLHNHVPVSGGHYGTTRIGNEKL